MERLLFFLQRYDSPSLLSVIKTDYGTKKYGSGSEKCRMRGYCDEDLLALSAQGQ